MNILIAGDFFISDEYRNKEMFDQSLIDLFQKADYRILNLEASVTPDLPKNKIVKTGPHLRMSENTVAPLLKQLNIDAVTLANNHILDYGSNGLIDTFNVLNRHAIKYVGAGNNLIGAAKPLTIEKDGMRIAILNFCENEWSIAEYNKPGANPLDIIDNVNQIKSAKSNHDKVICIIHGGHEYYQLPSPRMVTQYRFYADNGADAIVGHHTHCISGYEIYKKVPVIYSLGNFVFTMNSKKDVWYTGLAVQLSISETIKFELFPTVQNPITNATGLIDKMEKENTFSIINDLNTIITDTNELSKKWLKLIGNKQKTYLYYLSAFNGIGSRFIRVLFFKVGLRLISRRYLLYITNIIRCQSHADIINQVLNNKVL